MSAVPPSRLDLAQAEGEDRRDVRERGLEQDVVGEEDELRLVEPAHGADEGAGAVERPLEPLAAHAGAGVQEEGGIEGDVPALEGDHLLLDALVQDGEVVAREAGHGPAAGVDVHEELLEMDVDLFVDLERRRGQAGRGAGAGRVEGHDLDVVLGVLLAGVDDDPPGRLFEDSNPHAVEVDLDPLGPPAADGGHDLDLAEEGLAGRRADDRHLQGRVGGCGEEEKQEDEAPHPRPLSHPHSRPPGEGSEEPSFSPLSRGKGVRMGEGGQGGEGPHEPLLAALLPSATAKAGRCSGTLSSSSFRVWSSRSKGGWL